MTTRKLSELAKTVRSKNAGVNQITFDIVFSDADTYERVKRSAVLTEESVAQLYGIEPQRISHFVEFDVMFGRRSTRLWGSVDATSELAIHIITPGEY